MFISWMLITPSFKKSLIVEQFQGNYLKCTSLAADELNKLRIKRYKRRRKYAEDSWIHYLHLQLVTYLQALLEGTAIL